MSVRDRFAGGGVSSQHIVQFFDSDESRADSVAAFLAEGFRLGEPMIVVARPANWSAIVERLEALEVPVQRLISQGELVVKDAADTLHRLSRNGSPDSAGFQAVVAKAIADLGRRGRGRADGEMVDILAQRSDLADVARLESMWNELGARQPIYLMCGYCAAHFVAPSTHRALRQICRAHTDVHSSAHDPLAAWLLNSAHNQPTGESATLN